MSGPKATQLQLTCEQQKALKKLSNGHNTPQQIAFRAKIILLAGEGKSNTAIKDELSTTINTVRRWRDRWKLFDPIPLSELTVQERLTDSARSGAPAKITAEQRCQIEKLACETPESIGVPISQWSHSEIANEIIKRKIVDSISPRHAGRLLKRS